MPADSPFQILLEILSPEDRFQVENFLEKTWNKDLDLATTGLLAVVLVAQRRRVHAIEQSLAKYGALLTNSLQKYGPFTEAAEAQAKQVRNKLKDIHNYSLYPPVPEKVSCPPLFMVLGVIACIVMLATGYYAYTVGSARTFNQTTCMANHKYQQNLYATARHEGKVEATNFLLDNPPEPCK